MGEADPPGAGAAESPLVSVIIPVKDDATRLDVCLRALESQTIDAPFEILVVDNGSTRPPEEVVARSPHARLLAETRPGSYAARNLGVREARGEILAFTDSDCVPERDWLRSGCSALTSVEGEAFVGGGIDTVPQDPRRPTPVEAFEMEHAFPQSEYVASGYAATANLFVSRRAFDRVGQFDAELRSGGDMEWGQRAQAAGVQPIYAPEVRVRHPARRTFGQLRRKLARVAAGHAELRARRGDRLPLSSIMRRLVRLPIRAALWHRRSRGPWRERAAYAAVVLGVHYVRAYHQLRLEVRDRARGRA